MTILYHNYDFGTAGEAISYRMVNQTQWCSKDTQLCFFCSDGRMSRTVGQAVGCSVVKSAGQAVGQYDTIQYLELHYFL